MKRLVVLVCWTSAIVAWAAPQVELGRWLADGPGWLAVPAMSAPWVTDWDSDGRKDLLVGASSGHVYWYPNQGTDTAPVFNGRQELMSDGSAIITDGGG